MIVTPHHPHDSLPLIAIILLAIVSGCSTPSPEDPAVLRGRRLELVDSEDRVRVLIDADQEHASAGPVVMLFTREGSPSLQISETDLGPGVVLYTPDGKTALQISATSGGGLVGFFDAENRRLFSIDSADRGRLILYDNGRQVALDLDQLVRRQE